MNNLFKRYGRYALAVILTFALVFAAVSAYMLTRPAQFTARTAMMVQPPAGQKASDSNYVTLSGAMLPAVADLIHSPAFMESVVADVPGAPSADAVATSSNVEIVPSSIVLRVSTVGESPEQAQQIARNTAKKLSQSNIFGSLATLGTVETGDPVVQQSAPDKALGLGMAFLAATVAAALAAQLLLTGAAPLSRRAVGRIAGGQTAVFDLTDDPDGSRTKMLVETLEALGGVDVIPANEGARTAADSLRASIPAPARRSASTGVLLVSKADSAARTDLENAVALVNGSGDHVAGVAIV